MQAPWDDGKEIGDTFDKHAQMGMDMSVKKLLMLKDAFARHTSALPADDRLPLAATTAGDATLEATAARGEIVEVA